VATSSSSSASSSSRKVAKLAQRGKGKKVRFQGGTLFPAVVVGVVLVGLLSIFYARQSRPDPGTLPPQQGDHWHVAYGMYVCDGWLPKLQGEMEETEVDPITGEEQFVNAKFAATGIHSHDDGVVHWHANSTRAIGDNAVFGVFLDVYDVELSPDRLALPEAQGGDVFEADEFQCNGEDVDIKVVVWDNFADTGPGQTYITDLTDIRIRQDGMVFAIAVVPPGTEVTMPPWAKDLPELGAADNGSVPAPASGSSVPAASTVPVTTGG
jgi:hypothetical protein